MFYDEKTDSTVVQAVIEHGRTHQIRVHMTSLGHSLVGDTVYGQVPKAANPQLRFFPRQALHAAFLGFVHPRSGKFLSFEVPLPQDMADLKVMLEKNYKV